VAEANGRHVSPRFRAELHDFFRFLRNPAFGFQTPDVRAGRNHNEDWVLSVSPLRILQWAALLWLVNIVFLGPLAVMAAEAGGAQHRLDMERIPWLQALLWAPLVEELLFRYGLRRPLNALWVAPAAAGILFSGPHAATILLMAAVVFTLLAQERSGKPFVRCSWQMRRRYFIWFPRIFYLATLLFAVIHLHNFNLNQTPAWLLPFLVLPQFVTGLVLGWMRIRRGISAAILLHGMFNGGPLLLVWFVLSVWK